jgi:hypothetical protein
MATMKLAGRDLEASRCRRSTTSPNESASTPSWGVEAESINIPKEKEVDQ